MLLKPNFCQMTFQTYAELKRKDKHRVGKYLTAELSSAINPLPWFDVTESSRSGGMEAAT